MIAAAFRARRWQRWSARALLAFVTALAGTVHATDFSVSPIRAELRPNAPTESITVTNHSRNRTRVAIRLLTWSQDAQGKDVYAESADLVYFPRQMDLDPDARKVVRIGLKSAAGTVERTYRLSIEEMADPLGLGGATGVNFQFSFALPVFVPPLRADAAFEVLQPRLEKGKVVLPVRNDGNQHVRLERVVVTDPAGSFSTSISGWYSLAGTARDYVVDIPPDACRRLSALDVTAEGPGLKVARRLEVNRQQCA